MLRISQPFQDEFHSSFNTHFILILPFQIPHSLSAKFSLGGDSPPPDSPSGSSLALLSHQVQVFLGLAWALGSIISGALDHFHTKDCLMGKVYLCQSSLLICGITTCLLPLAEGSAGFLLFACVYGLSLGGYQYAIKMYLLERVKSRDFAQVWSLLQGAQSLPLTLGVPLISEVNGMLGDSLGFCAAGSFMILASLILLLSNFCAHMKAGGANPKVKHRRTQTNFGPSSGTPPCCTCGPSGHPTAGYRVLEGSDGPCSEELRRLLFGHPSMMHDHPMCNNFGEDDLEDDDDLSDFDDDYDVGYEAENGSSMPGMMYGDPYFDDNITSCNKVEHDLMFSEFEQNLSKESAADPEKQDGRGRQGHSSAGAAAANGGVGGKEKTGHKFGRLWTLRRQSTEDMSLSSSSTENKRVVSEAAAAAAAAATVPQPSSTSADEDTQSPPLAAAAGTGISAKEMPTFHNTAPIAQKNSRFQKQRSITVIEEVSA